MEINLKEAGERLFDLCIAGSGPAGIILALEYARLHPQKAVLLVEFGGVKPATRNSLDDAIEITNPVNHHPPYESTNKGFGGTSATWGGRCVMYDEIDFLDRPVLAGQCTWDSAILDDVRKYVAAAARYFQCGEGPFSLQGEDRKPPIAEHFVAGEVTDDVIERWSLPTRFASLYRSMLAPGSGVRVLLGHEAQVLSEPAGDGRIEWLELREVSTGVRTKVRAKIFVLAAGAQESTRLLLRNPQIFHQLSRPPSALGKYYQGHLSGKIASVRFQGDPRKTEFGFRRDSEGIYLRRRFQFSPDALCKRDLLNTAIWLDNPKYFDPSHGSGAMSFMYLAMISPILGRRLAPPAIAHSVTGGKVTGVDRHLWNIVRQLPGSLLTPAGIFFRRYCLRRKLPGVFLYNPENRYALHFHAEQVPDPGNRMELGADGNTLVIRYGLTDRDVASVIAVHELLDAWLRKSGCGELEYWFTKEELPSAIREMSRDGIHQAGTTRIAPDPETGVVDENLRVWGTENLHVCSSSAFPTSSQANPTFMLGAFAVRLAHHLA